MDRRKCLAVVLCMVLALGSATTALASDKETTTIESTSALMVRLVPEAVQQEVPALPNGDSKTDVLDTPDVQKVRHIQTLLNTGDPSTIVLVVLLLLASAGLAGTLYSEARGGSAGCRWDR